MTLYRLQIESASDPMCRYWLVEAFTPLSAIAKAHEYFPPTEYFVQVYEKLGRLL